MAENRTSWLGMQVATMQPCRCTTTLRVLLILFRHRVKEKMPPIGLVSIAIIKSFWTLKLRMQKGVEFFSELSTYYIGDEFPKEDLRLATAGSLLTLCFYPVLHGVYPLIPRTKEILLYSCIKNIRSEVFVLNAHVFVHLLIPLLFDSLQCVSHSME